MELIKNSTDEILNPAVGWSSRIVFLSKKKKGKMITNYNIDACMKKERRRKKAKEGKRKKKNEKREM